MFQFLGGLIIIAVGVIFVLKTEWFLQNFGRIGFFEQHFGVDGGSRLGYRIIGFTIIFFGILVALNLIGGFMYWVLGPLIRMSGGNAIPEQ